MDRERAKKHYDEAERLRGSGDPAAALVEIERAIEAAPDHPNAHNLAGWLLVTDLRASPGALEHAIHHFEQAHAHFPDDPLPLINLADALLASGQAAHAVQRIESAIARAPTEPRAHNWLGWYHLVQSRDLDRALHHLDKATSYGGWWGPAHQNRGLALETRGDLTAAYEAYRRALCSRDAHDVPFVYARLGALLREWGRPRRALSMFRRALRHERARSGARVVEIAGAARALEEALLGQRAYFPHEAEELAWIEDEVAAQREGIGLDAREKALGARGFRGFRDAAAAAMAALGSDPGGEHAARLVRLMLDAVRDRALSPDVANTHFEIDKTPLSAEAAARVEKLGEGWQQSHLLLYTRLLEREEAESAPGPAEGLGALVAAERHDEALAALAEMQAKGDIDSILSCVGVAEQAGDDALLDERRDRAMAYYRYALDGYRWHASGASSGGEGMARMAYVNGLEEKLSRARGR